LSLLLGLALAGLLLMFGLLVAAALMIVAALSLAARQWKRGRAPANDAAGTQFARQPEVLEGEFVVIHPQNRPVAH
jgi:HAMP domain-containing protein